MASPQPPNNSNWSETMPTCSRCASIDPNPSCFVCAEIPKRDPDDYDEDDGDIGHDAYVEKLLDRADYLRDEMKDREPDTSPEKQNYPED